MNDPDPHATIEDHDARAAWRHASSFADLGELGARFLEGDLACFPGWMADDIDDETDPLVPVLAGLCRGGFLTVASQPAGDASRAHDGRPLRNVEETGHALDHPTDFEDSRYLKCLFARA